MKVPHFFILLFFAFPLIGLSEPVHKSTKDLVPQIDSICQQTPSSISAFETDADRQDFRQANTDFKVNHIQFLADSLEKQKAYKQAINLYHISNQLLFQLEDNKRIAKSFIRIAQLFEKIPLRSYAEQHFKNALKYLKDDSLLISRTYYKMASLHHMNFDYKQANRYFQQAMAYLPNEADQDIKANYLHFQAIVYYRSGKYDQALEYLDSVISMDKKTNNMIGLSINLTTKARIYHQKKEYGTAFSYYKKAFDTELKYGDKYPLVKVINLASGYQLLRDYDNARKVYAELRPHLNRSDPRIMGTYYYNLFQIHYKHYNERLMNTYADSAIHALQKANDFSHLIALLHLKIRKYKSQKQYKQATQAYELIEQYRDSLENRNNYKEVQKAELEKEVLHMEQNFQQSYRANLQKLEEVTDINKQQYLWIWILALVVLALSLIYLISSKRKKQKLEAYDEAIQHKETAFEESSTRLEKLSFKSEQILGELNRFIHLSQNAEETIQASIKQLKSSKKTKEDQSTVVNQLENLLQLLKESSVVRFNLDSQYIEIKAQIKHNYPELTSNEEKLCLLLRLNYSVNEIASFLNISPRSVEMARYRLRKKLKFESNEAFLDALKYL